MLKHQNIVNTAITFCSFVIGMGVGTTPWIFMHDTDKVEGGFMVLFFGVIFTVAPPPWKFFYRRP